MNHKALFLACFVIILCLSSTTSRRLPGYRCGGYKYGEESCSPRRSLFVVRMRPVIAPRKPISPPDNGS
uniref:Uncharacterized protein n=1 Tax=Solanum tuberosum TaxID=4113 RepID=M1CCN8_SOLTU